MATDPVTTVRIKPAPYGGKNLNLLPPDDILRELLLEAKREFDWWSSLTDKEYDEIVARFGGEMSTRDYIDAKLLYHLNGILSIMSRTPFMREYQERQS